MCPDVAELLRERGRGHCGLLGGEREMREVNRQKTGGVIDRIQHPLNKFIEVQ